MVRAKHEHVRVNKKESEMNDRTIAVDLAKNVFEIGISSEPGQLDQTYRLSRGKFLEFFANHEPATVVMEACGSAHYWGRQIQQLGHKVVLISPQYVRPYVVRDKTDRADVKGLLEAYRNRDLHPVPIKTITQQQLTSLHRIRSTWMRTRTARINPVRGLLREYCQLTVRRSNLCRMSGVRSGCRDRFPSRKRT